VNKQHLKNSISTHIKLFTPISDVVKNDRKKQIIASVLLYPGLLAFTAAQW